MTSRPFQLASIGDCYHNQNATTIKMHLEPVPNPNPNPNRVKPSVWLIRSRRSEDRVRTALPRFAERRRTRRMHRFWGDMNFGWVLRQKLGKQIKTHTKPGHFAGPYGPLRRSISTYVVSLLGMVHQRFIHPS